MIQLTICYYGIYLKKISLDFSFRSEFRTFLDFLVHRRRFKAKSTGKGRDTKNMANQVVGERTNSGMDEGLISGTV